MSVAHSTMLANITLIRYWCLVVKVTGSRLTFLFWLRSRHTWHMWNLSCLWHLVSESIH